MDVFKLAGSFLLFFQAVCQMVNALLRDLVPNAYHVCKEQKILSFLNEWYSWNTYIECIGSTYEKFHNCCHRLLVNCITAITLF